MVFALFIIAKLFVDWRIVPEFLCFQWYKYFSEYPWYQGVSKNIALSGTAGRLVCLLTTWCRYQWRRIHFLSLRIPARSLEIFFCYGNMRARNLPCYSVIRSGWCSLHPDPVLKTSHRKSEQACLSIHTNLWKHLRTPQILVKFDNNTEIRFKLDKYYQDIATPILILNKRSEHRCGGSSTSVADRSGCPKIFEQIHDKVLANRRLKVH